MTNEVRKAIQKIEELPEKEQEEIAKLILEELSWDRTFESTQDQLSKLAKEAEKEIFMIEIPDGNHLNPVKST